MHDYNLDSIIDLSKRYVYCPKCGVDLEETESGPIYKVDNYYCEYETCPKCKINFITNFNGFCRIVDKEPDSKQYSYRYKCKINALCDPVSYCERCDHAEKVYYEIKDN